MDDQKAIKLPPIVPLPPVEVRQDIDVEDWKMCIETWSALLQLYVSLPLDDFEDALDDPESVAPFVISAVDALSRHGEQDKHLAELRSPDLCRGVFLLVHRAFHEAERIPEVFTDSEFLRNFSGIYRNTTELGPLIERAKWKGHGKKGKSKQDATTSQPHAHRLPLISQLQDIFPDLGTAFILQLLDEYDDDVETTTAHLLEDTLPPHLQTLDRTANLPPSAAGGSPQLLAARLDPRRTPSPPAAPSPPRRRNIYDDDAFDRLAVPADQIHVGRKNREHTADTLLSTADADQDARTKSKAAILSALAAFDADDDEYDDTYDIADVGASVDTARPGGADEPDPDEIFGALEANDQRLFAAWKADAAAFERGAASRRSPARARLRKETGLSDEAIEGFALMLKRDPRKLRRLEEKAVDDGAGAHAPLESTRWRAEVEGEGEETSGTEGEDARRGAARGRGDAPRGRGRGRGRGGGGGAGRAGHGHGHGHGQGRGKGPSRGRGRGNPRPQG